MRLSRAPLNHFDMLWLCGNATNVARQRATGIGYVSRGAARAGRQREDSAMRRSLQSLGAVMRPLLNYDLE